MKHSIAGALALVLSLGSLAAQACPPYLKGLVSPYLKENGGDLCSFSDRYSRAVEALEQKGVEPLRIADIYAPRFIKMKDWEKRKRGGFLKAPSFDPRSMYDVDNQPSGSVWSGWDRAAFRVDGLARHEAKLSERGYTGPYGLDINWIRQIHSFSLKEADPHLAGKFRTGQIFGTSLETATAARLDHIENTKKYGYPSYTRPGESLIRWVNTICTDQLSYFQRKRVYDGPHVKTENIPHGGEPFADPKKPNVMRQCGYYNYAEANEIEDQLNRLSAEINKRMNALRSGRVRNSSEVDPIFTAARAQRWFVSIHPFEDGNGRTSRFLMDHIVQSSGLPAPTIADTDNDYTASEADFARQIAAGMERVVSILEKCAQTPEARECVTVPHPPAK